MKSKQSVPCLRQGLQGWTGANLNLCFYPPRTAPNDRLRLYGREFGCVEVDSTNYKIPESTVVRNWTKSVPQTFVFHFKAHAIFCARLTDVKSFPQNIRSLLHAEKIFDSKVLLSSLTRKVQQALWDVWNSAISPVYEEGKLGVIVFQFDLGFRPSNSSFQWLKMIAQCINVNYRIAFDFRNREWIRECRREYVLSFLKNLRLEGVCLIASCDLEHELYYKRTLGPNEEPRHMDTLLTAEPSQSLMYIRVHR